MYYLWLQDLWEITAKLDECEPNEVFDTLGVIHRVWYRIKNKA